MDIEKKAIIESLKNVIQEFENNEVNIISLHCQATIVDGPDKDGCKTKEDTGGRYLEIHYQIKK